MVALAGLELAEANGEVETTTFGLVLLGLLRLAIAAAVFLDIGIPSGGQAGARSIPPAAKTRRGSLNPFSWSYDLTGILGASWATAGVYSSGTSQSGLPGACLFDGPFDEPRGDVDIGPLHPTRWG